jgi:hypothetical protein
MSQPFAYYYKDTFSRLFWVLNIPQVLKFWKSKFEITKPQFLHEINKYSAKKCQLSIIGMVS